MNAIIRKLKKEDAKELAHNIVTIWNSTYKGIVDDEFLKGIYEHENDSIKIIEKQAEQNSNYFLLKLDNKIIGWIYYTLDTDLYADAAEIHSLYVLKEYHKNGYGKHLLDYAFSNIKNNNITKIVIGCLDGNPSNNFYKHMGGKLIGKRLFKEKYSENIYLFDI